jgi:inhibitor of KinA sporulation pathway (predicted exonuclease)
VNFIIFDLEATCWEGRPPGMVQEIIEIGAYKVNRYGEVLSYFSSFVRPVIHPQLSLFCKQLTGIEQTDVNRADEFPATVEDWQDWIGIFDEDYVLASWGAFDIKQLRADCHLHHLETDWLEPNINLKRQYAEIRNLRKPRGLKSAVEKEGFDFTGEHHRAIDDAQNLVKVFRKLLDVWRY